MSFIPPISFQTPNMRFRTIAFFEGSSYLLLLVTMVLKYKFEMPYPNLVVGSLHGLLFVVYMVSLLEVWFRSKWRISEVFIAFVLSLIPFGTFFGEAVWWHKKQ